MSVKKVIQYILISALAVLLLYVSFKGVKWNDFIEGIKSCDFYWILLSMAVGIAGFVIRALRWRLLLKPLDSNISLKQTYNGVAIAYLTNFAVPRAGEIARCAVVTKKGGVTFEQALGTVVVERAIDLVCLAFFVLFTMLLKWSEFGGFINGQLLAPISSRFSATLMAALGGAVLLCVLLLLLAYLYRRKLMKFTLVQKIAGILKRVAEGVATIFRMKEKWLFLLYTLLLWGTYWCTSYATICAFPAVGHLNAADALFLMIVGGLGWAVPVQGGLGAYHFIVSLALLKVYAIPQSMGVVFATISHESQALVMILCGAAAVAGMWSRNRRLKKKHEDNL